MKRYGDDTSKRWHELSYSPYFQRESSFVGHLKKRKKEGVTFFVRFFCSPATKDPNDDWLFNICVRENGREWMYGTQICDNNCYYSRL